MHARDDFMISNKSLVRIQVIVSAYILQLLYFSLLNSHASYGLAVWGQCSSEYNVKIDRIQKQIIRAIKFDDHFLIFWGGAGPKNS